jgi:hypothetical protein
MLLICAASTYQTGVSNDQVALQDLEALVKRMPNAGFTSTELKDFLVSRGAEDSGSSKVAIDYKGRAWPSNGGKDNRKRSIRKVKWSPAGVTLLDREVADEGAPSSSGG